MRTFKNGINDGNLVLLVSRRKLVPFGLKSSVREPFQSNAAQLSPWNAVVDPVLCQIVPKRSTKEERQSTCLYDVLKLLKTEFLSIGLGKDLLDTCL